MGNSQTPSRKCSLDHFTKTFPSLSLYLPDEDIFDDVKHLVFTTCSFLESRNMDQKDRVYTKRTKEMKAGVREIIKKRANIIIKDVYELDMICNYFSYIYINGSDVSDGAEKHEKVYTYNWEDILCDIPKRTIKNQ